MKTHNTLLPGTCVAVALLVSPAALAADATRVTITKGLSGPSSKLPAELFHTSSDGTSSSQLNVAARAFTPTVAALSRAGSIDTAGTLGASISKNTLASKRSDMRTLSGGLTTIFGADNFVESDVSFRLEHDHEHDARSRSLHASAMLDHTMLRLKWGGGSELRGSLDIFPQAGLYHRRISSTADPVEAPLGGHGGPFMSLRAVARLGSVSPAFKWMDRLTAEFTAVRVRDTWVSGGYAAVTHSVASLAIDYSFAGDASVGKPSVALTRTVGTDWIANEPRKVVTTIALRFSYGI